MTWSFWTATCPGCTDRKSTRLNSSHLVISYAVFCLKKKYRPSKALGEGLPEHGDLSDLGKKGVASANELGMLIDVAHLSSPAFQQVLIFFFNDTATTEIYTLSLHDALPI